VTIDDHLPMDMDEFFLFFSDTDLLLLLLLLLSSSSSSFFHLSLFVFFFLDCEQYLSFGAQGGFFLWCALTVMGESSIICLTCRIGGCILELFACLLVCLFACFFFLFILPPLFRLWSCWWFGSHLEFFFFFWCLTLLLYTSDCFEYFSCRLHN